MHAAVDTRTQPFLHATVLCWLILQLAATPAYGQADAFRGQLDSLLRENERAEAPGCAVGVVQTGELTYANAYGKANLDYLIANTPKTVFNIGSVSKQFTAAAVHLAAREGALSLDDDIRKWLPEFPDYGTPITVRHLLHHTSGIRDHLQLLAIADAPDNATAADVLAMLSRQRRLNFAPGTEHLYSNTGYFLLAQIVERAAGMTFAEYADQAIFAPLGMLNTHLHDDDGRIVPKRAFGYNPDGDGFRMSSAQGTYIIGGGGVYSTVEDLARWVVALQADGIGGRGFSSAMMQPGTLVSGDTIDYGSGLSLGEHRELRTIFHGGASGGSRAAIVTFPDVATSVIVLCNLGTTDALQGAFTIGDIVLANHEEPVTVAASGNPPEPRRGAPAATFITLSPDRLAEYEGFYYSPELDKGYKFVAKDGALHLMRRWGPMPFAPLDRDRYSTRNGWARVEFTRDGAGRVTGFVMDIGRVVGLVFERTEGPN